jgi:hypothetical protein
MVRDFGLTKPFRKQMPRSMNEPAGESLIMRVLSEHGYAGTEQEVVVELRALLGPAQAKPRHADISGPPPRPTSPP